MERALDIEVTGESFMEGRLMDPARLNPLYLKLQIGRIFTYMLAISGDRGARATLKNRYHIRKWIHRGHEIVK